MNKEMELLRIFRVAAESSSFRDAAARLGTSPQGVTRAIQQLEQHYGEVLFHRSTRQVRISAFGEGLLDRVRPALERFEDLWRTPGSDQQASLSGTVRITAPHSLGTRAVLPALERVAERHPGITLDVRLSDRISNTVDEGIDVGIRVGFMRDSRFVARKAADMRTPHRCRSAPDQESGRTCKNRCAKQPASYRGLGYQYRPSLALALQGGTPVDTYRTHSRRRQCRHGNGSGAGRDRVRATGGLHGRPLHCQREARASAGERRTSGMGVVRLSASAWPNSGKGSSGI